MPFPSLPSPPALFPSYLVPSLPFRRRKSSTDSTDSTTSTSSTASDKNALPGHTSHLRCARCLADLALSTQVISKGFTGRHGRAYLVAATPSSISTPPPTHLTTAAAKNAALPNLPNTYVHKPVPRQLVTGAHTVGDISCAHCGSVLGWKYVAAEEEGQRYKVGKFILETKRVCRMTAGWEMEDEDGSEFFHAATARTAAAGVKGRKQVEEVEFDSQDEEECEDLFLGVWSPQLAAKRRKGRRFVREEV